MSSPSRPPQLTLTGNLDNLRALLDCLVATFDDVAELCTDDEKTFSYGVSTSSADEASSWLQALSPHTGQCDVRLACTIAEGLSGQLRLRTNKRLVVDQPFIWNQDLFEEPEDEELPTAVEELSQALATPGASISLADLTEALASLAAGGLALRLELKISFNKDRWRSMFLGPGQGANLLLFFFPCKFADSLASKSLDELEEQWFAKPEQPTAILLLRAHGYLEGEYLACFGSDALEEIHRYLARPHDFKRLAKLRTLRDKQCNWDGKPEVLAPDHFVLQSRGLRGDCAVEIEAEFQALAAQLAVGYLANKTDRRAAPPSSLFYGDKTCHVPAGRQVWQNRIRVEGRDPSSLLALYRWAYENYSGDQLGIVRQLIALQLARGPEGNARRLLDCAAELLDTARDNLQQLVRRNIAEYFAARNQVVEFLRKYTDEIGATISALTGELVSNLYKTLAAIIGAIVAARLTEEPEIVVVVTASLYCLYMGFIILYVLPSVWKKLHLKQEEYRNNVEQFVKKDVLMKKDIERFQGQSYRDSERLFSGYFTATVIVYLLLAFTAFFVVEFYAIRLLVP